jgi:homoserine dehydrogenase
VISDIADAVFMLQGGPAPAISEEDEATYRKIAGDLKLADRDSLKGRYYLRIHVQDHEGVLAKVSELMAKQHISFATVNQKELSDGTAKLMVTTHETDEAAVTRAKVSLAEEASVIGDAVSFRIFDPTAL